MKRIDHRKLYKETSGRRIVVVLRRPWLKININNIKLVYVLVHVELEDTRRGRGGLAEFVFTLTARS